MPTCTHKKSLLTVSTTYHLQQQKQKQQNDEHVEDLDPHHRLDFVNLYRLVGNSR
jgi:hypothetical protein